MLIVLAGLLVVVALRRGPTSQPPADPAPPGASGVARELTRAEQELFLAGQEFYGTCMLCHGPNGEGVAGQYPPLAGAPVVLGPPEQFARVLLHGLEGPVVVVGQTIDGQMPPAPLDTDREYAAVMTYVRRSFGNQGEPVPPELVARVREAEKMRVKPWTLDELKAIK